MRRVVVLVGLAALALYGCDEPKDNKDAQGDLKVTDAAGADLNQLDFGAACRLPTDPSFKVDVSTRSLRLKNAARGSLTISQFEVDAVAADIFVFDPAKVPAELGNLEEVEIPFTFVPKMSGTIVADLKIKADEKDPIIVKLLGEGRKEPPAPKFSMTCPGGAFDKPDAPVDGCAAGTPNFFFTDTPLKSPNELVIKLKNSGCPLLSITGIAVTNAGEAAFALAEGQASELSLPAGAEGQIKVRFYPTVADLFDGKVTFTTNDPDHKTIEVALKGNGTEPDLQLYTTIGCGFPDPGADPSACCDFKPLANFCTGKFTIRNSGQRPLTLNTIAVKGANPMFQITKAPPAGTVVEGKAELTDAIEVTYAPAIKKESDFLVVESTGGTRQLELRGGSPPFLETDPTDTLDFGDLLPVQSDRFKPVVIKNVEKYNKQLPLHITALDLTSNPAGIFTMATASQPNCAATIKPGDTLQPGSEGSVCVKFHSNDQGGSFNGDLNIKSDDPMYESLGGYPIYVRASTVCNATPVAEVSVVLNTTCPCQNPVNETCVDNACQFTTVGYSVDIDNQRSVELSGELSYDLMPDATGANCTDKKTTEIASYAWKLLSKPSGSTATATADATKPYRVVVAFDKVGPYVVRLTVTDKSGQTKSTDYSFSVTKST